MRNVLIIIILLFIFCSCTKESKRTNLFLTVKHQYGDRMYYGTLTNDSIRQGIWNFFSIRNNMIDSSCLYRNGNVIYSYLYSGGVNYEIVRYIENKTDTIFLKDYHLYRNENNLIVDAYPPSLLEGRNIYRNNCNSCHLIKIGKEINSLLPDYLLFFNRKRILKGNSFIVCNNNLTIKDHFFFELLNDNDIESIKLFLQSDRMTRSY